MQRRDFLKQAGGGVFGGVVVPGLAGVAAAADKPVPKRIRVGQIGVGHAHAGKLSVYRRSDDYEIVGMVEPDAELRKKAQPGAKQTNFSFRSLIAASV